MIDREMSKVPKIYVLVGYGDESETFIRSRKLWSDYMKNHGPNFYFTILCPNLSSDQVLVDGDELRVGYEQSHASVSDFSSYEKNRTWSSLEKIRFIHKKVMTFKYLLSINSEPFWVLSTTVTSAVSFLRIKQIIESYECSNFFGGAPIFKNIPYEESHFVMISGAGQLFSSDILNLVVNRCESLSWDCLDDIWTSLILADIPRTPFKRYDFVSEKSYSPIDTISIGKRIQAALDAGHFHFRVKSALNNMIKREDLDPLILSQIFEAIKESEKNQEPELTSLLAFDAALTSLNADNKLPSIVSSI
jgi:hypothetical protein